MKQGIHPEYKSTTIVCSCGNEVETRSTQEEIHVEICAVCHPFYTGRQKLVDTAGRVERFKKKYGDMSSGASEDEIEELAEEQAAEAEAQGEADAEEEAEGDDGRPTAASAAEAATPDEGADEEKPASADA